MSEGHCIKHKVFLAPNEKECPYCTIAALESKLKSSEEIRIAEKKILITEIEKNAALRAEVKRLNRQLEAWQRKSPFDTHIASYEVAIANLRSRLAAAEGKVEKFQKAVQEFLILYCNGPSGHASMESTQKWRNAIAIAVDNLEQIIRGEP